MGPFTITLNCPKSDGSLSDAHAFPPQSSFQTLPRFTTSYAQASRTQTSNWKWLLQRILQKVALEHYIEKVLHLKESAVMDPPMGGTTFFLFFLTIAKMDTQNLESYQIVSSFCTIDFLGFKFQLIGFISSFVCNVGSIIVLVLERYTLCHLKFTP